MATAVGPDDPRSAPKIHLRLIPRRALHPPERKTASPGMVQPPRQPADTVITADVTVIAHQILIDPLNAVAGGKLFEKEVPPGRAAAARFDRRPDAGCAERRAKRLACQNPGERFAGGF